MVVVEYMTSARSDGVGHVCLKSARADGVDPVRLCCALLERFSQAMAAHLARLLCRYKANVDLCSSVWPQAKQYGF